MVEDIFWGVRDSIAFFLNSKVFSCHGHLWLAFLWGLGLAISVLPFFLLYPLSLLRL